MRKQKKVEEEIKPPQFIPEATELPDTTIKEINSKKSTTKIKKFRHFISKKNKLRVVGFTMELRNGDNVSIMTFLDADNSFIYLGKMYVWDNDMQYYNKSSQLFFNDYHQDFALPISTRIKINELRDAVSSGGLADIEYATNPMVLKRFLQSSIQDLMLRGGVLWDLIKQVRLITIIILILGVLGLFLSGYAYYSLGVFSKKASTKMIASGLIFYFMKKKE
jgi:hypothetical protein